MDILLFMKEIAIKISFFTIENKKLQFNVFPFSKCHIKYKWSVLVYFLKIIISKYKNITDKIHTNRLIHVRITIIILKQSKHFKTDELG